MSRIVSHLRLLSVCVALACTANAQASKPSRTAPIAQSKGVRAPEATQQWPDGRYRADGSAAVLYRPDFKSTPANARSLAQRRALSERERGANAARVAFEYLAARHDRLGVQENELAGIEQTSLRSAPGLSVVRYRQRLDGLPVYGSDIAVSVQDDGSVVYVSNDSVRNLQPAAAGKALAIDGRRAIAVALRHLGGRTSGHRDAERMAYQSPDTGRTHVVWRVEAGTWELLVDEISGEVLRAQDRALNVDGDGMVFAPDPLSSARASYGSTGYSDGNNASTTQLSAQRKSVVLREITFASNRYALKGPYAQCLEIESPNDGACPSQAGSSFNFARNDKLFDAVNVYYHIDTFMRYVNQTLGVSVTPTQYSGGVKFDPHGLDGDDNSHYDPNDGYLAFGEGGVDDAQDADVVVHELGHGLHDWLTHGGLSQTQGLSEGVGDYLAAAYSRDFQNQWTPSDAQYFWVFNWDGHNEFWNGRVTNWHLNHSYPSNLGGTGHTAGQYWSSCNLVARDAIGGQAMDKAFLTGLSMTNGSSNQKDAAQAVINAAKSLGYGATQIAAIGNAYNQSCSYGVTVP
ncbi:hypothetical protein [Luteimonas aquatica]|uniref:hypothetical protein n=1 Tax=Luteimonas aquatica TaxID=450364 RepID=UPI001F59335D|nr:hypothetical protein [Luteimonas aquatica]